MAYTRSWDEASPADTDKVGKGAEDIRHFKVDIKERYDDLAMGKNRLEWNNLSGTSLPTIAGGSFVEIAGEGRRIDSLVTPSDGTGSSGVRYIKLIDTSGTITAEVTATAPVWSATYNGYYGESASADHKYVMVMTKDSTSYTGKTEIEHIIKQSYEEFITASGTWVAPFSGFFNIKIIGRGGNGASGRNDASYASGGGGGGGSAVIGYKRIYSEVGTTWTATFNTGSGANTTFSDGSTTISVQNGYTGSQGVYQTTGGSGGAGGSSSSNVDHAISGDKGGAGSGGSPSGQFFGGSGGSGAQGAGGGYGGISGVSSGEAGSSSNRPGGGGGGGGGGGNASGAGAGGSGGTALIRIRA
jgi:hypothetical protein